MQKQNRQITNKANRQNRILMRVISSVTRLESIYESETKKKKAKQITRQFRKTSSHPIIGKSYDYYLPFINNKVFNALIETSQ